MTFTSIQDETIRIRRLTEADIPSMAKWLSDPVEYGYPPGLVIYGMDQFIGEPALWGRGIGTAMIRLMMDYLFAECGADRITMDPVTTNLRAIRAYEKCGFTKAKLLPQQELQEGRWCDCWLLEAVRRP